MLNHVCVESKLGGGGGRGNLCGYIVFVGILSLPVGAGHLVAC